MQASGGEASGGEVVGTNCEACKGKHRPHTCKIVRRNTRGRKRRSPLEAINNALSFCAPGPRMFSCELCLAKDRRIASLERELQSGKHSGREIAVLDEGLAELKGGLAMLDKFKDWASEKSKSGSESESESSESEGHRYGYPVPHPCLLVRSKTS